MARRKIQVVKAGRGHRQITIDDRRMGGRFATRLEALNVVQTLVTVGQMSSAEVVEATRRVNKVYRHMPDVAPQEGQTSFQPQPKQPRRKRDPALQPWHMSARPMVRQAPRQNWQGLAVEYRQPRNNSITV